VHECHQNITLKFGWWQFEHGCALDSVNLRSFCIFLTTSFTSTFTLSFSLSILHCSLSKKRQHSFRIGIQRTEYLTFDRPNLTRGHQKNTSYDLHLAPCHSYNRMTYRSSCKECGCSLTRVRWQSHNADMQHKNEVFP
jgi:hypothetical protein